MLQIALTCTSSMLQVHRFVPHLRAATAPAGSSAATCMCGLAGTLLRRNRPLPQCRKRPTGFRHCVWCVCVLVFTCWAGLLCVEEGGM